MASASPEIQDIRSNTKIDLSQTIRAGLKETPPTLPTIILYDEEGLKLFEQITYLKEYYLTNCEITILENKSDEIVKRLNLGNGDIVVELGSGCVPCVGIH
jgi:L-histidine Nalpha-methyltransferase / hercynylcysteine S-oxide synthase